MATALPVTVVIVIAVALLSVVARRAGVAASIVLLLAGAIVSFIPGLPAVALDPDLVLLVLLPPLLYSAGVNMSWRGFRSNLRPILLLAVGCVLFTASTVAAVAHFALGLPWAVGFVLGAIISPPDAVAPMAVMRRLGMPRRVLTVLEGESLVNDATALVAFNFALVAVATGAFSPGAAAAKFAAIVAGETAYGIALGFVMLHARHAVRDARAEVLLALATPFIAFWPPHGLGGSGVVACVAAGLTVSWNGRRLIRPATRLQGYFIWDLVNWSIEGAVFLLTGLQARSVLSGLAGIAPLRLLVAGVLISLTVILVRFVWVFPATYLPRLLWPPLRRRDPYPDWRLPFMVAFTGLRGVVSLAAALSIPLTLTGAPFPERNFILFITFCVIVVTLVGQGLTLPWVARTLGLEDIGASEAGRNKRAEQAARIEGIDAALMALQQAQANGARQSTVDALRLRHEDWRARLAVTIDETMADDPFCDAIDLQLQLVAAERTAIARAYELNQITDEARRRIERELDLEEARSKHAAESALLSRGHESEAPA